ncbi:ionotropic receptor 75a-like [Ceratina calcarata]|uniref:Ionotropic receptor 75a-like n=1 Tax=Ceratina calcarata TaxID=156304 RepID=A0AAJ7SA57_9HYME|nr:ionotropic receptor 75a-like [Ceratina calcarata]
MNLGNFFYLQLIVVSYANSIDIIREYFVFKNVSRVAGFSCGEVESDYQITKILNEADIGVSVNQLKSTTDVSRFLHTKYTKLGIFLDLQCWIANKDVIKLLDEASVYKMFDHLHQWLILANNMDSIIEYLNDTTFSIITDLVIAVSDDDNYTLYDVYNHCKRCGGLLNVTKLGSWTKDDGLKIVLETNIFHRRWNFHKMKIRTVGFVIDRPKDKNVREYLVERTNKRFDTWSQFGWSVMMHVEEMFNMSYVCFLYLKIYNQLPPEYFLFELYIIYNNLISPPVVELIRDTYTSSVVVLYSISCYFFSYSFEIIEVSHWSNDTNGPLIVGLKNGIYDILFYPSIITHSRLDDADVILQVWPLRTCFMFRTVPAIKVDINLLFRPFTANAWYLIILLTLIIIFTLWITMEPEKDVDPDYGITVFITIAALCQQGLPFLNKLFATRIAFLQTMIFGLLVYNYYSAAIVSSRLNVPLNKMNDSLYSLVNSKLKLSAFKNVYLDIVLQSTAPDIQYFAKHWNTIPNDKKFLSLDDGVQRITTPGYAYHADPMNAYPLIERVFDKEMICQLTEVQLVRPSLIPFWTTRNSPFQEISKIGVIRMYTAGIQRRESIRWNSRTPYCNKDKRYVSSVTIREATPIIFVLVIGIIVSVLICLIEIIIFRTLRRKQEETIRLQSQVDKYDRKIILLENTHKLQTRTLVTNA